MAKYVVVAPNGESIFIELGYVSHEFKHGRIIENDKLAALFPEYFILQSGQTIGTPILLNEQEPGNQSAAPTKPAKHNKLNEDKIDMPEAAAQPSKQTLARWARAAKKKAEKLNPPVSLAGTVTNSAPKSKVPKKKATKKKVPKDKTPKAPKKGKDDAPNVTETPTEG